MAQILTGEFSAAIAKKANRPITLVEIDLPANGSNPAVTLRLTDQGDAGDLKKITIGGDEYFAIISGFSNIRNLADALSGFLQSNASARFEVVNLPTNLFAPAAPFSSIFQNYKPETGTVTVKQWFDGEGLSPASDRVTTFAGRLAAPVTIGETICSFNVIDLANEFGRRSIGKALTLDDYPLAPDEAIGTLLSIVLGKVERAPGRRVRKAASTEISSILIKTDTVLNVASTAGFPDSGTIVIDDDEITYTSKGPKLFSGLAGIDRIHHQGDEVVEKVTDHRFLFSDPQFAIKSITNVRIGPNLADVSLFSVDLVNGEVIFTEKPKLIQAIDSQFLQAQFDQVDASNNALNAANALDPTQRTTFATMSQANPILALKQIDDIPILGEITRVLLRIEHFETGLMPNDTLTVEIVGQGQVGVLSLPAAEDAVTGGSSGGTVDITHDHVEDVGVNIDLGHIHETFDGNPIQDSPTLGLGNHAFPAPTSFETIQMDYINRVGASADYIFDVSGTMTGPPTSPNFVRIRIKPTSEIIYEAAWDAQGDKTVIINKTSAHVPGSPGAFLELELFHDVDSGRTVTYTINTFDRTTNDTVVGTTDNQLGGATADRTGAVDQHSSTPGLANVTDPEKSSLSVVDFIDITSIIAGNWANFKDQVVQVKYNGSTDGREAFIINVVYEIEHVFKQVEFSDEITADVEGVIDDGSGTITGTPNALIERPDHVFAWSILVGLGLASTDIDFSGSQVNSFTSSGTRFADQIVGGYKLAGIIRDKVEARDLWRQWGKESRSVLYWEGKKARLHFLNKNGTPIPPSAIIAEDLNILFDESAGNSSIQLDRTQSSQIVNSIDLEFKKNFQTDEYEAAESVSDSASVTAYGQKEDPDRFRFDWVRGQNMAADLADFYLAELRDVYSYATFTTFLDLFSFERFDHLTVTHQAVDGDGTRQIPGLITGVERQLGAGQSGNMDLLKFTTRLSNQDAGFFDFEAGLFDDHAGLFDDG